MDAKTPATALNAHLPGHHGAERSDRESRGSYRGATNLTGQRRPFFGVSEIFKKTPCVADLKPAGRDVAKDMPEVGGMLLCGSPDAKLTDEERAAAKTGRRLLATNPTSEMLWKFARQVGAANGAVTHPGRAHEKQCYADV